MLFPDAGASAGVEECVSLKRVGVSAVQLVR